MVTRKQSVHTPVPHTYTGYLVSGRFDDDEDRGNTNALRVHCVHIVAYYVSRQMTTQNTHRYNINNISCAYDSQYNHYILPII